MRGRKPCPLAIAPADLSPVQTVVRSRCLPWFQVLHARILLLVAVGEPIQRVAAHLACDRSTVWRVCRRYEKGGLPRLLTDAPRVGHPQEISPPCNEPNWSNWRAWSPWLRGCTLLIGPAATGAAGGDVGHRVCRLVLFFRLSGIPW